MKKNSIIFLVALCFLYKSANCMTLREAIAAGNYECARELIMNGTDEESPDTSLRITDNEKGRTIFYMAAEHEDLELFGKLDSAYHSLFYFVNFVTNNGDTPLNLILFKLAHGAHDLVLLSEHSKNCHVPFQSLGIPENIANLVAILKFLLEHGAQYPSPGRHVLQQVGSDYW